MRDTEKKKRHAAVFDFPMCIYCGGEAVATTVDHVPARILFDGRIRPKGLEFPSCEACNAGTKTSEQVAAVLTRVYPDSDDDYGKREIASLFDALSNNVPDVMYEMRVPRAQEKFAIQRSGRPELGVVALNGPTVSAHLERFGAKLAFAFHFFATKKPIPKGGGADTLMYSNVNLMEGTGPDQIVEILGDPKTLSQGIKNVANQFKYNVIATEEGTMSMGLASFRESLAFATFTADETSKLFLPGERSRQIFRPGDFQKPVPKPEFPTIRAVFNPR